MKKIVSLFLLLFVVVGCSNGSSPKIEYTKDEVKTYNDGFYDFEVKLNSMTREKDKILANITIVNYHEDPLKLEQIEIETSYEDSFYLEGYSRLLQNEKITIDIEFTPPLLKYEITAPEEMLLAFKLGRIYFALFDYTILK